MLQVLKIIKRYFTTHGYVSKHLTQSLSIWYFSFRLLSGRWCCIWLKRKLTANSKKSYTTTFTKIFCKVGLGTKRLTEETRSSLATPSLGLAAFTSYWSAQRNWFTKKTSGAHEWLYYLLALSGFLVFFLFVDLLLCCWASWDCSKIALK